MFSVSELSFYLFTDVSLCFLFMSEVLNDITCPGDFVIQNLCLLKILTFFCLLLKKSYTNLRIHGQNQGVLVFLFFFSIETPSKLLLDKMST